MDAEFPTGADQGHRNRNGRVVLLGLTFAVLLGLAVRLPFFTKNDFTLNDGALFVQMAQAVLENGFALPKNIQYNMTEIPFAYPPLSFYIVALLSKFVGWDVFDVVRYLPLFFNILSIAGFVLLAARFTRESIGLLAAALIFPLLPKSYEWLIMGGGVTRSVGFFLPSAPSISSSSCVTDPHPCVSF